MPFDESLVEELPSSETGSFDPSLIEEIPSERDILSGPAEPAWPMPFGSRGSNPTATLDPLTMAIASRSNPQPGYTDQFAQDLQRSAGVRNQSEPDPLALAAGRFLNERMMDQVSNQPGIASQRIQPPNDILPTYREVLHGTVGDTGKGLVDISRNIGRMGQVAGSQVAEPGSELPPEPTQDPETIKAIKGIVDSIGGQVEGILQPEMLPLLLTGYLPGAIGKTATALFMADIYRHVPEIYNEVQDALASGDTEKEAKALTDAIGAGTFLGLLGAHLKGNTSIREGVDDFLSKYTPEQRAAFYQRLKPEWSKQLLEKPLPEKGVPNASSQQETTTVHGDLQSQPIESARKMPVEESSGGIQPQTTGRISEEGGSSRNTEPGAKSEVSLAEKESGWTSSPTKQIGGIKVEGLTPEEVAKLGGIGKELEFTDRRPGSITEGSTLYFPKDATKAEIISRMDEELSKQVAKLSPDEWLSYSNGLHKGGIGREATTRRLGTSAEEGGFMDDLKSKADAINKLWREEQKKSLEDKPIEEKLKNYERSALLSDQAQFFTEAHEFAKASARSKELPLSEFKGEVPETHVPIKVQRADGSIYDAFLVAAPGAEKAGTRIAKVKADTKGLSDGVLGKGDKIIEGPKTAEEYKSAIEAKAPKEVGLGASSVGEVKPFNFEELTDTELKKEYNRALSQYEGSDTPKFDGDWMSELKKEIDRRHKSGSEITGTFIDPFFYQSAIKPAAIAAGRAVKAAYNAPATRRAIRNLNNTRRAFGTLWKGRDVGKHMDQTMDAADNQAVIAAQQVRKGLEIGAPKADQNAAAAIIEAGFDREKLNDFLTKAQAGNNPEAIKAVQDAMTHWDRLQDLARRGKADLDAQLDDENAHGINTEAHEDYVPHIYDQDLWMGAGRPFVIGGGGGGISTGFKKGRTFPTIYDAIEAGYHPKSLALSELAEHRVRAGQKLINRKLWAEGLKNINDPSDGKPIATDLIRKQRGSGGSWYEVAPPGYRAMEIIPGVRTAIHEVYVPLFKALTGESAIAGSTAGKIVLETWGAMKHGLLAFDTFHASRIAQKQMVLTLKRPSYKKGASLLEYADKDLNRAVTAGEITPEIASWVRQNRPIAELGIKNGLNVGRVAEALYTSFVRSIPGIGHFNKWVFEKLTRGAMMESFLHEYNRVRRIQPQLTDQQVAQRVARDLNTYFGNLGRQGFFKSKTMQDFARIFTLAPQWVESMARTEAKGYAQLAKGLTYDPIVHKTLAVGTLGKAMGTGLIAYFIANQLLNLATRHQPTWKNDEEGHKMDAWVPSWDGKGNGFFLSTLAIPAELSHDMLRYSRKDGSALKAAAHILSNKASPAVRAGAALFTGKAFYGDTATEDSWGRVKKATWSLNPSPIPLQPLERKTYPGQLQRQVTASLGIKIEPAESASQQMFLKANKFLVDNGRKPQETDQTDDPSYSKLRRELRNENTKEAQKMLDKLLETRSPDKVFTAMRNHLTHPFTGSQELEAQFVKDLSDKDYAKYQQALKDRGDEFDAFMKLWYGNQPETPKKKFDPSLIEAVP